MGDGWGGPYPPMRSQGRGIGWACNKYCTPPLGRSRVRPGLWVARAGHCRERSTGDAAVPVPTVAGRGGECSP